MDRNQIPESNSPIYSSVSVNEPIDLYSGKLTLHSESKALSGNGSVSVTWLPFPEVRFNGEFTTKPDFDLLDQKWELELLDKWPGRRIQVSLGSARNLISKELASLKGSFRDEWKEESSIGVASVIFHVVNFDDFRGEPIACNEAAFTGRAEVQFGDWFLQIDSIQKSQFFKDLQDIRGYGTTHVAKLQRVDREAFEFCESWKVIDSLYWFLSFCCGRWVGGLLECGLSETSEVLANRWNGLRISGYRSDRTWFSKDVRMTIPNAFPGFWNRWSDDNWQTAIKNSIYWYVLATSSNNSIENGIVLSQVIFEMLGWNWCVQEANVISEAGFTKLDASDKLRLLLSIASIPSDLPTAQEELCKLAKAENLSDGPQVISYLRNAYVHPTPKNLEKLNRFNTGAEYESWDLAMHYVELILLKLFGYDGEYFCRVAPGKYKGARVRNVPWATASKNRP